ncbi:hypothetical protein [Escherichia coli]
MSWSHYRKLAQSSIKAMF